MKVLICLIAAGLACHSGVLAAEPAKPLLKVSVKKQILDSDYDLRGKRGSSKQKIVTLRVEIVNTSSETIDGAQLSGHVLVRRSGDVKEKLVKEALGAIPLPQLKPNAEVTIDLGKIDLHELEWRKRSVEESLDEWKVICTRTGIEIGKALSSERYEALEATAVQPEKPKAAGKKKRPAK